MIKRRTLMAASVAVICTRLEPDKFCPSCGAPWTIDAAGPGDVCDGLHCETRGCVANQAWLELLEEKCIGSPNTLQLSCEVQS